MDDVAQRGDLFARHAADVDIAVEIDQRMRPWGIAGMLVIEAEGVSARASQADLGLVPAKGKGIFIRNDQPQGERALRNARRDLLIEFGDILFAHGQNFAAMVIHRDQVDPVRAEFVSQVGERGERLVVRAADHGVDADGQFPLVLVAPEEFHGFDRGFERAFHAADLLVHLPDGRIYRDIHPAQTRLHQPFGFLLGDERAIGGHGDFDIQCRRQFHKIGDVRSQHRFAAGDVDLLRAHLRQFGDDFLEPLRADGRLARLAPVIAHLTFEVAAVEDLEFDV